MLSAITGGIWAARVPLVVGAACAFIAYRRSRASIGSRQHALLRSAV